MEQPENNCAQRKGRSFICPPHPILEATIVHHQDGISFCQEMENGVSNQFPQPFRALHKGPTSVSLHPETGRAEMCRDGLEQGRRARATNICHTARATRVRSGLLCGGPQQLLPQKKLIAWIATTDSLEILHT